jgi:hypothetical protein
VEVRCIPARHAPNESVGEESGANNSAVRYLRVVGDFLMEGSEGQGSTHRLNAHRGYWSGKEDEDREGHFLKPHHILLNDLTIRFSDPHSRSTPQYRGIPQPRPLADDFFELVTHFHAKIVSRRMQGSERTSRQHTITGGCARTVDES